MGKRTPAIIAAICERLEDGESLVSIGRDPKMPSARAVQQWMDGDDELASQITRAREIGYITRAERAIDAAKTAEDAAKGRLAFDAERWYLGKLSNAFSDKQKVDLSAQVTFSGLDVAIKR